MDGRLLEQARGGDRAAFDALYATHAPAGWRLAYALTGAPDDAADVLASGAARAFGPTSSSFLPSPAHVELCHRIRDAAGDAEQRAAGPHPFEVPDASLHDLALAFAALPERSRSALWLRHVETFSAAHAATVLEVPEEYVDSLVERAEHGMRQHYLERHVLTHGGRNCDRAVSRLGSYVAGTLPDGDVERVERHLRLCQTCADRAAGLATLTEQLPAIVPPMPDLTYRIAGAWLLAVTPAATTGTGLSALGEKVVAGVSAAAAAVAVVGAAIAAGNDRGDVGDVVPTEAVVADLSTPDSDQDGPDADRTGGRIDFEGFTPAPSIDRPAVGDDRGTSTEVDSSTTVSQARIDEPSAETVAPAAPGPAPTIPTAPADDDGIHIEEPTTEDPLLSLGTTVGDESIAVEVGSEPGVTVGPVSLGSEPAPSDELIEVGSLGL